MKTVYTPRQERHNPAQELCEGKFIDYYEKPDRARFVLQQVVERKIGPVVEPESFPLEPVLRVHDRGYIAFLQEGRARWEKTGKGGDAYPAVFNLQNPAAPEPKSIFGQLGYYMADGCAPLTVDTWGAVWDSACSALTAQKLVAGGEKAAFALCRPPGHHAAARLAGGYCYINNAAVAAQAFIDRGAPRVAILDIDYHHGNGTQDIFYGRADVLMASIHADPSHDYPFYLGYKDEKGRGAGEGFNLNYPLPLGTDYKKWTAALDDALGHIRNYGPAALIVSLGVDTFKRDPISKFTLDSPDYLDIGRRIEGLKLPTLFVMEGGYAIAEVGVNAVNVLSGFLGA